LASAGAVAGQIRQSFDEHGMSLRRYCSLTIFWTLPLLVDRMKTLLVMFAAVRGSACRLRLFIDGRKVVRMSEAFVVETVVGEAIRPDRSW
jgi:hypothetical protein